MAGNASGVACATMETGANRDDKRDFAVVVFGPTGIAGRNVAAYLAERAREGELSWAVAGRDPARIGSVLSELGVEAPEKLVADVEDPASLAAMAARTRVVIDLVGPYTLYGEPVIEACIAAGTHYIDLTGEIPFVRRMIDAHHARAAAAGVKIVQVGGFEALPADLSVAFAAATARERWSEDLAAADAIVTAQQPKGMIGLADLLSGGTMQSMAEAYGCEGVPFTDSAALITDPTLADEVRSVSPISVAPRADADGAAIAPMSPAAFINPAVIHRTMALDAERRGVAPSPFRYSEGVAIPGGVATLPLRYLVAALLAAPQAALAALSRTGPATRKRIAAGMRRLFPGPGFGPAGEKLEQWTWQVHVAARTDGGHHLRVEVDADGHPGYLTTSWMIAEAGLLLAEDEATPATFGCLTPAAALGTERLERFARAGLRFKLSS